VDKERFFVEMRQKEAGNEARLEEQEMMIKNL